MKCMFIAALLAAVLPAKAIVLTDRDVAPDPNTAALVYGMVTQYGKVCNPLKTDRMEYILADLEAELTNKEMISGILRAEKIEADIGKAKFCAEFHDEVEGK